MSKKIKVAAIQMDCVLGDKEKNLKLAEQLIENAVQQEAKVIVIPELFSTGYRTEESDASLAETIPGPTTEWMTQLTLKHNVYLLGAIIELDPSDKRYYDTAVVAGPGVLMGKYRKIHLWDKENSRFGNGDEYPVFNLGFATIGVQICYEVGFPEGARLLTLQGADIIAYPSAFGLQRLYAWDLASRARALENGAYVIACNRSGTEKGETEFAGNSRIINPKGEIIINATENNQVLVAELDLDFVKEQRQAIPYLRDLNKEVILKTFKEII